MRKLLISLAIASTILFGAFTSKGDGGEDEEEPPDNPVVLKDGNLVGVHEAAVSNVLGAKQAIHEAKVKAELERRKVVDEREEARKERERIEKERQEKERKQREAQESRKKAEEQAQPIPSSERTTGEWQTFEATYYGPDCVGCSGITATGIDVRNTIYHNGMRVIAVDPRQIPLGSIVEVQTPNESFRAIAGDTGGAIKGRIIDVLVSSEAESYRIGRHSVKLRIIK